MAYRKLQREFFDLKDSLTENRDQPARADGTRVELLANINNVADAQAATPSGPRASACSAPSTCSSRTPTCPTRRSSTSITARSC